jgi:transcriptional regulator with XRE-family HTH domain
VTTTYIRRRWDQLRAHLIEVREAHKLTRTEVARRCHLSHDTVSRLESGRVQAPSIEVVVGYCDALDRDLVDLPRRLAQLVHLEDDDIVAILRAARAAAEGHRLNPVQARRVADALAGLNIDAMVG